MKFANHTLRRPVGALLATLVLAAAISDPVHGQATPVLLTAVDASGTPLEALTADEVALSAGGRELGIVEVVPASADVQVAIIFEGLAASPSLVSEAITTFSSELSADSAVDVFTVSEDVLAVVDEAVADFQARQATRPVIVLLGQPQSLNQSRLGLTIARGVAGDLDGDTTDLAARLETDGVIFYGVSVTDLPLDGLVRLAASTGGRFEIIPTSGQVVDRLRGIARELAGQYVLSYDGPAASRSDLTVTVDRPGVTVRLSSVPGR